MNLPRRYRWLWLLAAIAVIAVVAFAACKEDKDGGKTPAAGNTPLAADQTLRVRLAGEPQTLDPQVTGFDVDISIVKQLFRGLFYYDGPDMNVVPAVATKLPTKGDGISDDGLTYTIELRDDMTWSDGKPVTAGDFVYALKRLFDPAEGAKEIYENVHPAIVGRGA